MLDAAPDVECDGITWADCLLRDKDPSNQTGGFGYLPATGRAAPAHRRGR
jgi:hypothetical protein